MKFDMKKAIVTGASGFIGQNLVRFLTAKQIPTIAVDIVPFPGVCQSLTMDIAQPGALNRLLDADTTVFHLAARASVPGSVKDPKDDFHNTLYGLFELLESARATGSKVLFPSTASVFDPTNKLPLTERAYVRPTSPYAAAKVAGEAYASAYHRCYGVDIRIARMFSVYGTGMNRFVIYDTFRKILANPEHIEILGDGEQIRDYLFIDDVLEGIYSIMTNGQPGEDYNLASGVPVRIIDLVKLVATLMDHPNIRITTTGQSFAGDVLRWYADIQKISEIGFTPKISLTTGLQRTIDWLHHNVT